MWQISSYWNKTRSFMPSMFEAQSVTKRTIDCLFPTFSPTENDTRLLMRSTILLGSMKNC